MAAAALLLAGALAGCSSSSTTTGSDGGDAASATTAATATTAALTRPFAFRTINETFVDASRPTEAGSQTPSAPERTLETTVYVPETPGAHPLIVFSHGLSGHPDKFTDLLTAWAEAGYVVAAPAFPITNDKVPGSWQNAGGVSQQPRDVSFVIDQLLAANDDTTSPLQGTIDATRIGVGGLSLGGATTYSVAFSDCCRDPRVKAAAIYDGVRLPIAGDIALDGHVPLLIVHGDHDPVLPVEGAVDAFVTAKPPVWLVTLLGAGHAEAFENTVSSYDALVERFTTDWWDMILGGDASAQARFATDAQADGLSTLQARPEG